MTTWKRDLHEHCRYHCQGALIEQIPNEKGTAICWRLTFGKSQVGIYPTLKQAKEVGKGVIERAKSVAPLTPWSELK